MKHPNVLPLQGFIQPYDWGGFDFIPNLLGEKNRKKKYYAELWMGEHHNGPSTIQINGKEQLLKEWVASDPNGILGRTTAKRFKNNLPFLFKILDVRKMLSIQAHPTKKAAEKGYRREERKRIAISDWNRNYKDQNHKPEVMVALTDFWLLHGFRSAEAIDNALGSTQEFKKLQSRFARKKKKIKPLYRYIMGLSKKKVEKILAPLARRLKKAWKAGELDRSHPDYWAAQAFRNMDLNGHYHRGVFSIYLFNLVHLKAGEGIFQDANIPHAYLEGVNVELMANSDNVFRGGLTTKHIDRKELMKNLSFEAVEPNVLTGEKISPFEKVFTTPAPNFELSRIQLAKGATYLDKKQSGPAIFILLSGSIDTEIGKLKRGEIFFSPHGAKIRMKSKDNTLIFRAGVPA